VIPNLVVDAVVHQPYGAHPSYAQGYYDRDNQFYLQWDRISREPAATRAWLDEWVYGVADWPAYLAKLAAREPAIWERLAPGEALSQPVNYGIYG
jgi:glutaconate CoA-transferase, subunit A